MRRLFTTLALVFLTAPILSGTVLLKGGLVHSGNGGIATVQDILISENIIVDGEDSNGDGYSWYSEISTSCQDGVSTNFTYLENFGHSWPASDSDKGGGEDIDGATFIWEFLSLYDISGLIN